MTAHAWVCQYGYRSACAVSFGVAARRLVVEQRKGEGVNRKIQIYSISYALSSALDIGLEFKILPHPQLVSLVSSGAFFGGACVRFGEEKTGVREATCLMDMANAVVYVGVGSNRLSTTLSAVSPSLGFTLTLWQRYSSRFPYLPI